MNSGNSANSFWQLGITGLLGVAIGAGGMFFSQKQANVAENQYFMELDQLRHSAFLNDTISFEDKLENLKLFQEIRTHGFRTVFENNLHRDITEITASIANIEQARKESAEAADQARKVEETKAAAAAQLRKEQAVRTNPLIFENCGFGTKQICP